MRAYNDFLLEWCSADPKRLLSVVATPFWDIPATVAEIERAAAAGARGVLFTGEPQRYGLPVLADKHWDPLWSVAQAAGLPIHFHIGNAGEPAVVVDARTNRGAGCGRLPGLRRGQLVHEERRPVL